MSVHLILLNYAYKFEMHRLQELLISMIQCLILVLPWSQVLQHLPHTQKNKKNYSFLIISIFNLRQVILLTMQTVILINTKRGKCYITYIYLYIYIFSFFVNHVIVFCNEGLQYWKSMQRNMGCGYAKTHWKQEPCVFTTLKCYKYILLCTFKHRDEVKSNIVYSIYVHMRKTEKRKQNRRKKNPGVGLHAK